MTIVFDMDNTLTDDTGGTVRPGMAELIEKLDAEKYALAVFTNSTKQRALMILRDHGLRKYFRQVICREDYDPYDKGVRKDIRKVNGDLLIDDDPAEVAYAVKLGKKGYCIKPYRNGQRTDPDELDKIYNFIKGKDFWKIFDK
jgi:FMN phosphatase YigB (HAD superfamily)